jgi:hypothetical protein
MSTELVKKWLAKLTRLNPASGRGQCRGKAPHKPLLLLCLLDMAEAWPVRVFLRPFFRLRPKRPTARQARLVPVKTPFLCLSVASYCSLGFSPCSPLTPLPPVKDPFSCLFVAILREDFEMLTLCCRIQNS